jgi:hypothetical protein
MTSRDWNPPELRKLTPGREGLTEYVLIEEIWETHTKRRHLKMSSFGDMIALSDEVDTPTVRMASITDKY